MIRFIPPLLAAALLISFHYVDAAEICPAIDCDCASLPNENWQKSCSAHEERIKNACAANSNTPKDYCSIHGLNAKPLPLAIELSEFDLVPSTDIKALNEKITSMYWALQNDTAEAQESFDKMSYARSLKIMKLVDSNIDNIFQLHQQVAAVYKARDSGRKAAGHWRKSVEKTLKVAEELENLGNYIYKSLPSANTQKDKKIFSVLAQKALRMSGKAYEHGGYAAGRSKKHKNAAKAWGKAAGISKTLAEINRATDGKNSGVKFSEFQAAARLHRASYFWTLQKDVKKSAAKLGESKEYLGRDAKQNIDFLVESEAKREKEESERGVLSGLNR